MEHIEAEEAVVAQLYKSMQPGGRIYFYLPAFNHLRTAMDDLVGHHRRYTRSQLIVLVSQAGFTHEDSGHTDFLGVTYDASLLDSFLQFELVLLENEFWQATYCYHAGLDRRSLLVDAGGGELNKALRGICPAVTGYEDRVFKPVD